MTEGDPPQGPSRITRAVTRAGVGLVALLLVAATVAYWLDLGDRWGIAPPDPRTDPAAVAPPPGLDLPDLKAARPVAEELTGGRLAPAAVRHALGHLADARKLGRRVSVVVGGVDGRPVYDEGPATVTPASTMKLLTCLAALKTLGPEHRFTTSVVRSGPRVVLVGGGDPMLASRPSAGVTDGGADLATLARATAHALEKQHRTRIRLGYDASLFSGPVASPAWEPDYLSSDVVSPITALWIDQGREKPGLAHRVADPAADAADHFAKLLGQQGVTVVGKPSATVARGSAAQKLASVSSAELVEIIQRIVEVSDNEGAEVLAHHVGLAEGRPGSFAGGAQAVRAVLGRLGVPLAGAVIQDGSGLARSDRLPTRTLLDVLATALDPDHPTLAGLVEGLPVAGFSGSLGYRFDVRSDEGLGRVRAKTGTLTGVSGLAGVAVGRDGAVMTFVAVADQVKPLNTTFTRARLDQIAAALAGCRCLRAA
jgi:D-alanyl-D-alanine carboxypeptidase/D-alanyl-D-alanine-endopeptidase (penicillin-binding protein 4)